MLELGRRLVRIGALTELDVDAILREMMARRRAFLRVVEERFPSVLDLVVRELERSSFPRAYAPEPAWLLLARLPSGSCAALAALPVDMASSPRTQRPAGAMAGGTPLLMADPFDRHTRAELERHLGGPTEPCWAPLAEVDRLLARVASVQASSPEPPAAWQALSPDREHAPPIPLVRRHSAVPPPPGTLHGVAPQGAGGGALPTGGGHVRRAVVVPPRGRKVLPALEAGPVIVLTRAKGSPPSSTSPPPGATPAGLGDSEGIGTACAVLDAARSTHEVVEALVEALAPMAAALVVLGRTGSRWVARRTRGAVVDAALGRRSIQVEGSAGLRRALAEGFFLGHLLQDEASAPLLSVLAPAPSPSRVAALTVYAAGQPSLVLVMAGFHDEHALRRGAAQLAVHAGGALERLSPSAP